MNENNVNNITVKPILIIFLNNLEVAANQKVQVNDSNSKNKKLSEDFIREFATQVDWEEISCKQKFNKRFFLHSLIDLQNRY